MLPETHSVKLVSILMFISAATRGAAVWGPLSLPTLVGRLLAPGETLRKFCLMRGKVIAE